MQNNCFIIQQLIANHTLKVFEAFHQHFCNLLCSYLQNCIYRIIYVTYGQMLRAYDYIWTELQLVE